MSPALELGRHDLVDVEEAVLLEADLDERRFHAREDVVDGALVDVPCDRPTVVPLEVDLGDLVVLEHGDALLADVDGDDQLALGGRRQVPGESRFAGARCVPGGRLRAPLDAASPRRVPASPRRGPLFARRACDGFGRRGFRDGGVSWLGWDRPLPRAWPLQAVRARVRSAPGRTQARMGALGAETTEAREILSGMHVDARAPLSTRVPVGRALR